MDRLIEHAFCWVELGTTDCQAAKKFYREVFDWDLDDAEQGMDTTDGNAGAYATFRLDGKEVAAVYTLAIEQEKHGIAPHWMPYIAVDSSDEASDRAQRLGANVVVSPFDLSNRSRIAGLQDPTGAMFAIWQPIKDEATGATHAPGALSFADLYTPDPEQAAKFYSNLFDWEVIPGTDCANSYLQLRNRGELIANIPPNEEGVPAMPPGWLAYFQVDGIEEAVTNAEKAGGKVYLSPTHQPGVGIVAVLADPQGAVFAIVQQPD